MRAAQEGNAWTLILKRGEPVMASLEAFAKEHHINHAEVTGVGQLSNMKIGYLKETGYHWNIMTATYELLSFLGTIAWDEKDPEKVLIHIHVATADENGHAIGGHLSEAHVGFTLELIVKELGSTKFLKTIPDY